MSSATLKRVFDLALAALAALVSLPIQVAAGIAVARELGRPILFRQQRPGLHGKPFELVKFRTMRPLDPQQGWIDDASRLTRLGTWLRATSIDELPTLWNVLRGDMSLVGPRPLLMEYLDRYSPEQARRHDVRPGLTGLAQVSGRNGLSWEDKFRLDLEYIDRQSLWLDVHILILTVGSVARREGISALGQSTAPEFKQEDGP